MFKSNRIKTFKKKNNLHLVEQMFGDKFAQKFGKEFTDGDKNTSSSTTTTSSSDTETETVSGSSSFEDDGTNKEIVEDTSTSKTYSSTDSVSTVDNQDKSKNTVIKTTTSGPISLTNDARVSQNKSNNVNQAETIRPTINKTQSVSAGGIDSNILIIIILVLLLAILIKNN